MRLEALNKAAIIQRLVDTTRNPGLLDTVATKRTPPVDLDGAAERFSRTHPEIGITKKEFIDQATKMAQTTVYDLRESIDIVTYAALGFERPTCASFTAALMNMSSNWGHDERTLNLDDPKITGEYFGNSWKRHVGQPQN